MKINIDCSLHTRSIRDLAIILTSRGSILPIEYYLMTSSNVLRVFRLFRDLDEKIRTQREIERRATIELSAEGAID